jgi:hypothetical protein
MTALPAAGNARRTKSRIEERSLTQEVRMAAVRNEEGGRPAESTRMTTREKLMLANMIVWGIIVGLLAVRAL